MKAKAHVLLDNRTPEVVIDHNGEKIPFSVNNFKRESFNDPEFDVFQYLNDYWSHMPLEEQSELFNCYHDISRTFDTPMPSSDLHDTLIDKVEKLMSFHKLERIKNWVYNFTNIRVPATIEHNYVHNIDLNTSRGKTYIREDYLALVVMALSMKAMVPVWGEYINHIRANVGTTFKEYYAFLLLGKTEIIDSPALHKLKTYIDSIVGTDNFKASNTLNNISSEDYTHWLLCTICLRRLCTEDIRGKIENDKYHLISAVYKFIVQRTSQDDSDFKNKIRDKTFNEKGDGDGRADKLSFLELYKNKSVISIGSIVLLEHSMSDIEAVVKRLSLSCPTDLLHRSIETASALSKYPLSEPQVNILRWVFKPVISAKGILHLPKDQIIAMMGAAEAVLWTRGFKYLALVSTAYIYNGESSVMVISPVDSKMRVPEELVKRIDTLYPYTSEPTLKKTVKKADNPAMVSIDNLSNSLIQYTWRSTSDESMITEVMGNPSRKLSIRPDIKTDLAKLVIQIGERSWS